MADLGENWRDRMSYLGGPYSDRGGRADYLGGGSDLLRPGLSYEAGRGGGLDFGSGLGLGGTGGLPSMTGVGRLGSLDDLSFRAPKLTDLDIGLGGRPPSLGLSHGVARNLDLRQDILPVDASSTLYVDGLPLDCTRREAAHIFRPYPGFKGLRLLQREGKRSGDKVVLCFVEFADVRCAANALKAVQDYKFDETDENSYKLWISFARNPPPRGADDYDRRVRRRRSLNELQ